jgi:undecaprenyl-diphosphatase
MQALPFSRRQALFAGLGCWAVVGIIAVLVQSGATASFDVAGMLVWRSGLALDAIGPDWLTPAFRIITMLGEGQLRNILLVAAIGVLLVLRQPRAALWLAPVVLPAGLVNGWLKLQFLRSRPDMVPHLVDAGGYSFPSGHAFSGAALYVALVLPFAALATGRERQWTIIAAGLAIAGWLGGAGWVLLGWAAWPQEAEARTKAQGHKVSEI